MKLSTKPDGNVALPVAGWIPDGYPRPGSLGWAERLAVVFALAHIVCESWIALSQGFLALAVIALAVAIRKKRLSIEPDTLYVPLLLFAVGSTLSAVVAPHPLESIRETGEWFNFLTVPVMFVLLRQVRGFIRAAVAAFCVLYAVTTLWGLVQFFALGRRDLEHRITGPTPHVMTFSGIVLPLCVIAVVLFLERRRLVLGLAALTGCLALVATLTRSAWIGWLVGMTVWILLRRSRALIWMLPAVVLVVTLLPLSIFGRLTSTFDLKQYSNFDRIRMFEAGGEIIRDHTIFGVGPGNVSAVYARYRRSDAPRFFVPHLHDNVIQIWAERGLIPLFAFLMLFAVVGARCLRIARSPDRGPIGRAGLAAIAAIFTAGFFEFNFGDSEVLMTLLCLIALLLEVGEHPVEPISAGTNGTGDGVVAIG